MSEDSKNMVYIEVHKSFVKENLTNSKGQNFNAVTIPPGTVVNGVDVSNYYFSPYYINLKNKFKNGNLVRDDAGKPVTDENSPMRSIPLQADKEQWLMPSNIVKAKNPDAEIVKCLPQVLKDSMIQARKEYVSKQNEIKSQEKKSPQQLGADAKKKAAEKNERQKKSAPDATKKPTI